MFIIVKRVTNKRVAIHKKFFTMIDARKWLKSIDMTSQWKTIVCQH